MHCINAVGFIRFLTTTPDCTLAHLAKYLLLRLKADGRNSSYGVADPVRNIKLQKSTLGPPSCNCAFISCQVTQIARSRSYSCVQRESTYLQTTIFLLLSIRPLFYVYIYAVVRSYVAYVRARTIAHQAFYTQGYDGYRRWRNHETLRTVMEWRIQDQIAQVNLKAPFTIYYASSAKTKLESNRVA